MANAARAFGMTCVLVGRRIGRSGCFTAGRVAPNNVFVLHQCGSGPSTGMLLSQMRLDENTETIKGGQFGPLEYSYIRQRRSTFSPRQSSVHSSVLFGERSRPRPYSVTVFEMPESSRSWTISSCRDDNSYTRKREYKTSPAPLAFTPLRRRVLQLSSVGAASFYHIILQWYRRNRFFERIAKGALKRRMPRTSHIGV